MHIKQIRGLILTGLIFLYSCSDNRENALQTVEIKGKQVPIIELSKVKDTISLSLSRILDDVSFIKLETTKDNKLTGGKWYIGDKYIIGYCKRSGIFQFTSGGKFIRKIANYGKGPQEVFYPAWTVSKGESLIYIYDLLKPKDFLCFDLNSGLFIKSIPVAIEGQLKNICLVNDSILACAPVIGTGKPAGNYYIFWQNLFGKLIRGVLAGTISKPIVPNENLLYPFDNYLHYRPVSGDTIFQVNDFQLEPYFIFDLPDKPVSSERDIGKTIITVLADSPGFLVIEAYTINSKEVIEQNTIGYSGTKKHYLIDKLTSRPYIITSFYNDLTGEKQEPVSFEDQISNLKYISVESLSLLNKIKKIKSDTGIRIKNRSAFIDLESGLNEDDNPVLLVGKFVNN